MSLVVRGQTLSAETEALFRSSDIVDLHIDSFIWTRMTGYNLHKAHGAGLLGGRLYSQADIPRVKSSLTGAKWVITTNPYRTAKGRLRAFKRNLGRVVSALSGDEVQVVSTARGYREARARGQHVAFIGVQGGNAFDAAPNEVGAHCDDQVCRVTLVHLTNSMVGDTSSPLRLFRERGLTAHGADLVRGLNRARIFVDLAHISEKGFADAVAVHDKSQPLIVSHTGVNGVFQHWRNVSDAQMRQVADTGGVIGVMYQSRFLGDAVLGGRAESVVEHLAHIVDTVGEDHAALGSDWDGWIVPPRDLLEPSDVAWLIELMLRRGMKPETVQKILGLNFLRSLEMLRG